MAPYPVDQAHPSAVRHPTTGRKMFEVTTTANHATRYVQGSLRMSVLARALLVSSSGLSHVLSLSKDRARWVGDALHFLHGSQSAQSIFQGSPPSLLPRNRSVNSNAIRLLMCNAFQPDSSAVGNYDTTISSLHNSLLEPLRGSL